VFGLKLIIFETRIRARHLVTENEAFHEDGSTSGYEARLDTWDAISSSPFYASQHGTSLKNNNTTMKPQHNEYHPSHPSNSGTCNQVVGEDRKSLNTYKKEINTLEFMNTFMTIGIKQREDMLSVYVEENAKLKSEMKGKDALITKLKARVEYYRNIIKGQGLSLNINEESNDTKRRSSLLSYTQSLSSINGIMSSVQNDLNKKADRRSVSSIAGDVDDDEKKITNLMQNQRPKFSVFLAPNKLSEAHVINN
jgi:hypothetical protein